MAINYIEKFITKKKKINYIEKLTSTLSNISSIIKGVPL